MNSLFRSLPPGLPLHRQGLALALLLLLSGCGPKDANCDRDESDGVVKWTGEMKATHAGDLSAHIKLESLQSLPHLYAVGPLEGMKGEISIFDSTPSIATVADQSVSTTKAWNHAAPFLVYAQVSQWSRVKIPASVTTTTELETFIVETAKKQGVDTVLPFPFKINCAPAALKYHVVANDGYPQQNNFSRVSFTIEDKPVEIVGFYSEKHQGVFTQHGSNTHMHVKSADGKTSGHIDELKLKGDAELFLPKR
jgi:acetolactate decarboxylase